MAASRICVIDNCGKPTTARSMCKTHYARFIRSQGGRVTETMPQKNRRIETSFVSEALASDTQECITWPFGAWDNGYGYTDYYGKRTGAHRLVCKLAHGEPPDPKMHAAHLCPGNRKCINPKHVRWATPAQNSLDVLLHGLAADPDFVDKFIQSKSAEWWERQGLKKPADYARYRNHVLAKQIKTAWQITQLIRPYVRLT
jgi:hypothetical protein